MKLWSSRFKPFVDFPTARRIFIQHKWDLRRGISNEGNEGKDRGIRSGAYTLAPNVPRLNILIKSNSMGA